MTIAGKINVLVIAIGFLLGSVVTGYTAMREYHFTLDQLTDASAARVLSRPDLQVELYQRDKAGLEALLTDFLEIPAVASVVARDGFGAVLARRFRDDKPATVLPTFQALRGDYGAAETSLTSLDESMQPAGTGLWAAIAGPDSPIHLTIPVFTPVNPAQQGLTAYDFFQAAASVDAKRSLRVIGYVELDIAREDVWQATWPNVSRVLYGSLALLVLFSVLAAILGRSITDGLKQLSRLADEVVAGRVQKPVDIKVTPELKQIVAVFNSVIGGFSSTKQVVDVDHQLLSLKVDERTSQLSLRDEELNKATEEISQTKTQLQQLAYYDSLTTLPNRRLFTEQLGLLLDLNQRNRHTLALLFVNLDNFKRINDSLGHEAGDRALLEVGRRLVGCVRDSDRVAHNVQTDRQIDVSRLGGDEFTVVLNQLESIESAGLVARRVVESLIQPLQIDDHEVVVTPSIGIAVAPGDGADVQALLRSAGIAMHHAKESPRESYLFYSRSMDATGVGRLKLEAELRKAVERSELVLHYQPQVNTLTGAVVGAEALLRWEHPELGTVPPFQFIPLAEEIGVIGELGDWVLAEACRQMKEFDAQSIKLPKVAINVSAFQFNAAFVARVSEVLQQFGLPGSRLELGLTEGILMDNDKVTAVSLKELKDLGVYLSVDDFGTGSAPLSYLARHDLDELKLDRSFVIDCDRNESRARLVSGIISMAKSLELSIVAEGVEREEQYRFLINKGAQIVQGYLFSKPVPAAQLKPMLAPWHFVEQVQGIQG